MKDGRVGSECVEFGLGERGKVLEVEDDGFLDVNKRERYGDKLE